MAGKARNRVPLELATCISIDSLSLARQPKGWNSRGRAMRSVSLRHSRGAHTVAMTSLYAEIAPTSGTVKVEHQTDDGQRFKQSVDIEPIPTGNGGHRWLLVCPVTGGHARKLYRYPGSRLFCSRMGLAEPVTYHCQRDAGAKRVMRQIWELRHRIGAKGALLQAFDKPAGMADAEFIRYARRYLELADRLDFTIHGLKLKRAGRAPQAAVQAERGLLPPEEA